MCQTNTHGCYPCRWPTKSGLMATAGDMTDQSVVLQICAVNEGFLPRLIFQILKTSVLTNSVL